MARINLLPWRETRRAELKKEFLQILAVVIAVAGAIVFLVMFLFNQAIDSQNARNDILQKQIDEVNRQVAEIAKMKKQKKALVARMKVIQSLQGDRPEIVHLFDEIVRTLPEGVFYQLLNRSEGEISIKGVAESNSRVSSLMRRLDESEWFDNPNLKGVSANRDYGDQANNFDMTVQITSPKDEESKE